MGLPKVARCSFGQGFFRADAGGAKEPSERRDSAANLWSYFARVPDRGLEKPCSQTPKTNVSKNSPLELVSIAIFSPRSAIVGTKHEKHRSVLS